MPTDEIPEEITEYIGSIRGIDLIRYTDDQSPQEYIVRIKGQEGHVEIGADDDDIGNQFRRIGHVTETFKQKPRADKERHDA